MHEIMETLRFAFTNRDKTDNIPESLAKLGIEVLEVSRMSDSIELEIDGKPVTLIVEVGD